MIGIGRVVAGRQNKYELLEKLGEGGMAEVFRGRLKGAAGFQRDVAIKRIRPSHSQDPEFRRMLTSEANLASLLNHPNIVAVQDFGEDGNTFFLVMELVEGPDLFDVLKSGSRPMPVGLAVYIVAEVLAALSCAQQATNRQGALLGIVHRDVSPQNVLLSWNGAVKLTDFGIARVAAHVSHTGVGVLKGKLGYLSPEQLEGRPVDRRTDLFAVGVILHEMLTGRPLFSGTTVLDIVRALRNPVPPPSKFNPSVPAVLDAICAQLLAVDPNRRFSSADEALRAIHDTHLQHSGAKLELPSFLAELFPGQKRPRGNEHDTDETTRGPVMGSDSEDTDGPWKQSDEDEEAGVVTLVQEPPKSEIKVRVEPLIGPSSNKSESIAVPIAIPPDVIHERKTPTSPSRASPMPLWRLILILFLLISAGLLAGLALARLRSQGTDTPGAIPVRTG